MQNTLNFQIIIINMWNMNNTSTPTFSTHALAAHPSDVQQHCRNQDNRGVAQREKHETWDWERMYGCRV